jgi:hypothetical protein
VHVTDDANCGAKICTCVTSNLKTQILNPSIEYCFLMLDEILRLKCILHDGYSKKVNAIIMFNIFLPYTRTLL